MRERLILTAIWTMFFLLAAIGVLAYTEILGADGLLAVLPEQRMEILSPVLKLYGLYLGGILVFWFVKPFPRTDLPVIGLERARFWIAFVATAIFNAGCLWLLVRAHFVLGANVLVDVKDAMSFAENASWIVAPANAFYFGTKSGHDK